MTQAQFMVWVMLGSNALLAMALIYSRARLEDVRDAFQDLVDLCELHADFRNGNTHPDNPHGTDEGETRAWEIVERLKKKAGVK